jgi:signal transduction histidine kinase/ActR/RegA family two-component response regulator/PAS domain-containing protein
MRRPTEFVLEKAGWPALLLEESGTICRANRAACQLFGTAVQGVASFSALLEEGNGASTVKVDRLLADLEAAGKPGEMKLACPDGKKVRFNSRVTRLSREGRNYFVVQLFDPASTSVATGSDTASWRRPKEAGAAPIPTPASDTATWLRQKEAGGSSPTTFLDAMEVPFALTNAEWPALVVDKIGTVVRANPAATRIFGAAVRKGGLLGEIWPGENVFPLEKILMEPSQGADRPVKLKAESGAILPFQAQSCPAAQSKWVLLQLFREGAAPVAKPGMGASPDAAKSEPEFLLQEADWPAVILRKNGEVVRGNRAAVRAFGTAIEKPGTRLGIIWSPENKDTLAQFLSLPAPTVPPRIKIRLKSGMPAVYLVQMTVIAGEEACLLQFLKEPAAGGAATAGPGGALAESSTAQRQKLECALQLARSVALDFNNALTSILGHTSLLLSKTDPSHPWRSSLVEIEKSADKAAEVASDLASFSLQEKDGRAQTAGNLNTLLERTVEALQNSLPGPVTITRQLERKLFTVNFDEAKMQQALVRMLENAVEAIKTDGRIKVETRNVTLSQPLEEGTAKLNAGNYVCVEIADNGGGIPADVMPRVFEPFFTTKGNKHRGLGLAWVYGIVTNHGGGVALNSQPGQGTTARVYLPANDKIVRETALSMSELRGGQTILMVDDEDLLLTMGQMVLSSFGYTVLTASSGIKALELFSHWKDSIDLVLVDLVMPNMSGRELTEQIRKIAPRARILWCSGYVRSSQVEESDPYLQKPFTSQDLLRAVKTALVDVSEPEAATVAVGPKG